MVIATRDRPEDLDRCLASVLACDHDSFEVIVVDQSVPPSPVPTDDRIVHVPTATRGKSAGLNVGVAAARADLVAFTDDDCTVPPDWLDRIEELFARYPEVALAFGELRAIPYDPSQGWVPEVDLDEFRIVRAARSAYVRGGAGANMAARRAVFDAIGGYDELIGPGSRFQACEEYDVYYRVLTSGQTVAFTPELTTTHWGLRLYDDGSGGTLKRRYAYGEGAVIGKHLRLGDARMAAVAVRIILQDLRGIGVSLWNRRIIGIGILGYKFAGIARAVVLPVDRRRHVFAD